MGRDKANQRRVEARYKAENIIAVAMKLNLKTDADILQRLDEVSSEEGGKQGYVKALIRIDIARHGFYADAWTTEDRKKE